MSFFRKSKCGRRIRKPHEGDGDPNFDEDSLQSQIEFLRAKIDIKERYNKAVLEELEASHSGAKALLKELTAENEDLRYERSEAINEGKTVASKALRRNRIFQLALLGKDAFQVLNWLDDKLFDLRKKLDDTAYRQNLMRQKLADAETMVGELEKWPFPGSLPWEKKALAVLLKLGMAIADEDSLRDSAKILNLKYKCILQQLKDERTSWPYSLLAMQSAYDEYAKDMSNIEQMLTDGLALKQATYYRLVLTKQEFYDNRKARKLLMANMRKKIEKQLATNHKKFHKAANVVMMQSQASQAPKPLRSGFTMDAVESLMQLKFKQAKLQEYEDRARVLIDTMRVRDLRYCPRRLQAVAHIHEVLQAEMEKKKQLLSLVVKQKGNLNLIQNHLLYAGCAQMEEYEQILENRRQTEADIANEKKINYRKMNKIGDFAVLFHSACTGICDKLMLGKGKMTHETHENYLEVGNYMQRKLFELVESVNELRGEFTDQEPARNYALFVRMPVTKNACRLSQLYHLSNEDTESSEDDFAPALGDVVTREGLKDQADRIYNEAMARKGYR